MEKSNLSIRMMPLCLWVILKMYAILFYCIANEIKLQELIAGINNTIDGKLIDHLRLYGRKDKLFEEKNALRLTDFDNDEQYQRLCLFEPLHDAICISCTNKSFFIISKNDHKVLFEKHGSDVYDVSSTEDKVSHSLY